MSVPCRSEDDELYISWSTDNPEDTANFVYGYYNSSTQTYTWDSEPALQMPPKPPLVKPPNPPPVTPPVPPRVKVPRPCIPLKPPGP